MWRDQHGCAEMFFKFVAFYYGDCENYVDIMLIILSSYEDLYLKASKPGSVQVHNSSKNLNNYDGYNVDIKNCNNYDTIMGQELKYEDRISQHDNQALTDYQITLNSREEVQEFHETNNDTIVIDDDLEIDHSVIDPVRNLSDIITYSGDDVMTQLLLDNNSSRSQQQQHHRSNVPVQRHIISSRQQNKSVSKDNKLGMDYNDERRLIGEEVTAEEESSRAVECIQNVDIKEEEVSGTGELVLHDNLQPCSSTDNSGYNIAINSRQSTISHTYKNQGISTLIGVNNRQVCGQKAWISKQSLQTHSLDYASGHAFQCDICGKIFKFQSILKKHVSLVHMGNKPYSCDYCGKCFGHKPHLTEHMRIHTGEKPFACELCGKMFTWKTALKTHMLSHLNQSL